MAPSIRAKGRAPWRRAAARNIIKVEKDVPATMRDGTKLYADIYRPDAAGRFPVILLRLPYGKHVAADFRRPRIFPGARLCGGHPGCARALHLGRASTTR